METDRTLAELEKRIRIEYAQAAREIDRKAQKYWENEKIKDRKWQEWVRDGVKTKDQYDAWLKSQIMNGERWEAMKNTIAEDLTNVDQIAKSITQGYMPEVYSQSFAYGTFEVEKGSGVDTSFTLYSRESLEFLFRENPQILPEPGKKVAKDIAEGKAKRWNKQHVQSVMIQAILQGNSIPDIAMRLSNAVCDTNRKAAIRNARTMATGTQNAGRIDSYKRGEEMGIKTQKQWISTLDMRTRHEHRILDGVTIPLDEKFIVEDEEIRFPGDPTAAPHLVYNCRCTLVAKVAGWKSMADVHRSTKKLEEAGLDYESWKESRKEIHNPIDLPEQKREAIRAQFIRGYRGYGGPVAEGMDRTLDVDFKAYTSAALLAPANGSSGKSSQGEAITGKLSDTMSRYTYNQYRELMENVPEDVRVVHEKYLEYTNFTNLNGNPDEKGARFEKYENTVYYNIPKVRGDKKFFTLCHENGHAIDASMAARIADGHLKELKFTEYGEISRIIGFTGWDKVNAPSVSDIFLNAMRNDAEVLKTAVFFDSWKKVEDDIFAHVNETKGIQDFLDGIFRNATATNGSEEKTIDCIIWGHGDKYYDSLYDKHLGKEIYRDFLKLRTKGTDYEDDTILDFRNRCRDYITACELWANINSAICVGGYAEEAMRTFAPNAVNAYMKIMEMASDDAKND